MSSSPRSACFFAIWNLCNCVGMKGHTQVPPWSQDPPGGSWVSYTGHILVRCWDERSYPANTTEGTFIHNSSWISSENKFFSPFQTSNACVRGDKCSPDTCLPGHLSYPDTCHTRTHVYPDKNARTCVTRTHFPRTNGVAPLLISFFGSNLIVPSWQPSLMARLSE